MVALPVALIASGIYIIDHYAKSPMVPVHYPVTWEEEACYTSSASGYLEDEAIDHKALSAEALMWLSVLNTYNDSELTTEQLTLKLKIWKLLIPS